MPFWIKNNKLRFPLKIGINIVGRQKGHDIQIKDPYVSRRHLSIDLLSDDSMTLMDLGSSNGLFVNGKKVPNAVLRAGESFTVGVTNLSIEESGSL